MKSKATYLLDTNICIYTINKRPEHVIKKVKSCNHEEICISSITIMEMEYGLQRSKIKDLTREALIDFILPFEIINFNSGDAYEYGKIRAHLESIGKPIGAYDLQLAAQAISRKLILVTNNVKEFSKIPEIEIENWYDDVI